MNLHPFAVVPFFCPLYAFRRSVRVRAADFVASKSNNLHKNDDKYYIGMCRSYPIHAANP
jgi:hypothetical protein